MALEPCRECKAEAATEAKACPHCRVATNPMEVSRSASCLNTRVGEGVCDAAN